MTAPLTDEQITRMARARASFKVHLFVYVAVNLLLMVVWMMTQPESMPMNEAADIGDYWPMWTHIGWGIGLAFHGLGAYGLGSGMVQREEEKLRRQMGKT